MRPTIFSIRLYIYDETGEIISLPHNNLNRTLLYLIPLHKYDCEFKGQHE